MTEISDIRDITERLVTLLSSIDYRLEELSKLLVAGNAKPAAPTKSVEWADPRDFDANTRARLEADDEPPDSKNAHVQGGEFD